ncbi:uncharacterized protein LOC5502348 isoform X2 [Nematostella vectensis]|uniref:uncharacterized protein LOC5502348 isoform X2 n=1 Tax=Nematostella vectensis TaxID=45351 RepID=UPI002076DDCB|nr:uncharacterized protein LOC5502348 isoform X2 [Nematostella vectensis]
MHHRLAGCVVALTLIHLSAGASIDATKPDPDATKPGPDAALCSRSAVDYNVTLAKGRKAGKYFKINDVHNIDACLRECCGAKRCDVAFMVRDTCYLVQCFSAESCDVTQSVRPEIQTILSVAGRRDSKIKQVEKASGAEPAIEENLAVSNSPYVNDGEELTTISAFGTGKYKRTKRSSDIIDLVVAVGCGTVAVCVGVAGVIMMTRRLIDNSKNSAS